MTEPTVGQQLTHDARIRRMLADPECVGELLLVGIGMARCVDLGDPRPWPPEGQFPLKTIAYAVYGRFYQTSSMLLPDTTAHGSTHPRQRILDVFFQDRRRYSATVDGDRSRWSATCGRPMQRREGLCGRNPSPDQQRRLTDPVTGQRRTVAACSRPACRAWFADLLARNAAELKTHPPPVPPANTGGVLERHLPEIDWWKIWRHVDKNWAPPPEGQQFDPPKLTLLLCDAAEPDPEPPHRPTLVVHKGGWR